MVGFADEFHKDVPNYEHWGGAVPEILNSKFESANAVEAMDMTHEEEPVLSERDLRLAQVQAAKDNSAIFCIDCTKVHNKWKHFPFTLSIHPKEVRLQPLFSTSYYSIASLKINSCKVVDETNLTSSFIPLTSV